MSRNVDTVTSSAGSDMKDFVHALERQPQGGNEVLVEFNAPKFESNLRQQAPSAAQRASSALEFGENVGDFAAARLLEQRANRHVGDVDRAQLRAVPREAETIDKGGARANVSEAEVRDDAILREAQVGERGALEDLGQGEIGGAVVLQRHARKDGG